MLELFAGERAVVTEAGQPYRIRYYILAEEAESAGSLLCENYGVRIVSSGDGEHQSESLRQITVCLNRISRLVQMLAEHLVTPTELRDVVEDWVAAG